MHFQRRRNSAFIDGVGDDARVLAEVISRRTGQERTAAFHIRRDTSWSAQLPI
jgi:hypothetical protein